jgi:hypothetical protein
VAPQETSCPGKEICGAFFVFMPLIQERKNDYVRKEDPLQNLS